MNRDGICRECFQARPVDDEEDVCEECWYAPLRAHDIATGNRGPCRDCWDPVDRPGEILCDWCAMTPMERSRKLTRSYWFIGALIAALAVFMLWGR